ncbi:MAG: hypothetical protein JO354_01440 [Verrucomicrobia bacterium]|nr:hypothetical protein [Verrucomicrobiota bacterium]
MTTKTSSYLSSFLAALALAATAVQCHAQISPKSSDLTEEIEPDGSIDLTVQMSFDAKSWNAWRAAVGDDPARLRAMFQHQFAAYTLENFKLERDDVNRTAKLTMHSPTGLELRSDGMFHGAVEPYFHLINNAGRVWYFSGNNPNAADALTNVKVMLPGNSSNATLLNAGTNDQALAFSLAMSPPRSRVPLIAGIALTALGIVLLIIGLIAGKRRGDALAVSSSPLATDSGSPPKLTQ